MPTIFSRIVAGEIPCYSIKESSHFLAFLDINPLVKGHTLVIPKVEIDYIFDLEDDLLASLFVFAKQVGRAIEKAIPCERIGISVIGLEVPHTHVHLIPINFLHDMNFSRPKLNLTPSELEETAASIRTYL